MEAAEIIAWEGFISRRLSHLLPNCVAAAADMILMGQLLVLPRTWAAALSKQVVRFKNLQHQHVATHDNWKHSHRGVSMPTSKHATLDVAQCMV
jgi:hypothetical protein